MTVATVTDLKTHLDITTSDDDGELQDVLDAAVKVVEGLIGPLEPTSVTETHYSVWANRLLLRRYPVMSLGSISIRSGVTNTALVVADYELDAAAGEVRLLGGGWLYGTYTVTYTAGRAVTDADKRLATLLIADQLWESQRVPGASRFGARGGEEPVPRGFAVPNRAKELLGVTRSVIG